VTPASPALELDRLVIAAASLEAGIAWSEATFGLVPDAGGAHPRMGTHNRIFSVASARFPRAYLEIIAIDPAGAAPAGPRWFGLDDAVLQASIDDGPQLIHWAARCADLGAAIAAFRAGGCDPGDATPMERRTPQGWLHWQITIRGDGRLQCGGAWPTLVEWGEVHPSSSLVPTGVTLVELGLGAEALGAAKPASGPREGALAELLSGSGAVVDGALEAPLCAVLDTPRGRVVLEARRPPTRSAA
jgi:hypothetical protein